MGLSTEILNLMIEKLQMASNPSNHGPKVTDEVSNLLNNELHKLLQEITKKSIQKLDLFSPKPTSEPTQLVNLINQKLNLLVSSENDKDQQLDLPTLFNLIG